MSNSNSKTIKHQLSLQEKEISRSQLIDELDFLCRDDKIFDTFVHQLKAVKSGFKKEIDALKRKSQKMPATFTTSGFNQANHVIMIVTEDDNYKDYIQSLERFPKYRKKRLQEHLAIKRVFNKEQNLTVKTPVVLANVD